jgi:hypothetical protein
LFEDAEIHRLSDRLFGFHVDAGGQMTPQSAAARAAMERPPAGSGA